MRADTRDYTGVAYKTAPPIIITIVFGLFFGEEHRTVPRTDSTVPNCRCSPHFLPQSPKVGAGRGSGGGNRIVTQMRSLGIGQVLSRNFQLTLPLVEGGNAVRFSLLCFFGLVLVLCRFLAKFSSSKGRFLRKIFGSELLFLLSFWALMFLIGICLWFSRIF